jgi:ATP-dependent 26S proteasome regulatory subunit
MDENDVGEARRIVSTFLQLLDADESSSILIAATNERASIDRALFRRFDDVVPFELPSVDGLAALLRLRTSTYGLGQQVSDALAVEAQGLSYADVTTSVVNAVKSMVLEGREELTPGDLALAIGEISSQREFRD